MAEQMSEATLKEFDKVKWRSIAECSPTELLTEAFNALADSDQSISACAIREEYKARIGVKRLRKAGPQVEDPIIIVEKDYDGYFESLVRSWIKQHKEAGNKFLHKTLRIVSGPYRSSAVTMRSDGESRMTLDFYSAIRSGFGELTDEDVQDIKDKWL